MLYTQDLSKVSYDPECDILNCTFSNQHNSYGDEDPDNIVVFRDLITDEITGIKILDIKKMYASQDNRLTIVKRYINLEEILPKLNF
ncbi:MULTISPECIES: hypothetical protein [Clostridia]|uniref:hypothetical protein n=1 Tax=Clostridia TaxID=186801 RepID=UPI00067F211A|nr:MULTISPECIES: hypothetical protein [Clostridia]